MYTWNQKWIKKYESPWLIVNKFMLANDINGTITAKELTNSCARKVNRYWFKNIQSGIISNYYINTSEDGSDKLKIAEYGEEVMTNLIRPLLECQNRLYNAEDICSSLFKDSLYFCPKCLEIGVHPLYNQFTFINKCLIHNIELKNKCPHCKKELKYGIYLRQDLKAFQCNFCGQSLLPQTFDELVDSWYALDSLVNRRLTPFSSYCETIPIVLTNSKKNITDNVINAILYDMFFNKPISIPPNSYSKRCCKRSDYIIGEHISSHFDKNKYIINHAYYSAFKIYYRHIKRQKKLNPSLYKIQKLATNSKSYKLATQDVIDNIITDYYNFPGLIFYLWKRDMEYELENYMYYSMDACKSHPYFFAPNSDIMNILEKVELATHNVFTPNKQYNLLIQITVILMKKKYELWEEYLKQLAQIYNPHKIFYGMNSINLASKIEFKREFLLLIEKGNLEYKLFYS